MGKITREETAPQCGVKNGAGLTLVTGCFLVYFLVFSLRWFQTHQSDISDDVIDESL